MTQEEKAKAYDEALERAKAYHRNELAGSRKEMTEYIFPELRESDDEKMIRVIAIALTDVPEERFTSLGITLKDCLAYLEKQKEPHYTKRNAIFDKCVENCDPEVMKEVSNKVDEMLGKEQKPSCWNSPVMTHEMIMNEQKPAEWSEEDEKNCNRIIRFLEPHKTFFPTKETKEEMQNWLKNRLKSLRPQPKQEWNEELDIDTLREWSMRYAPDIRQAIESTAYHFYNLRPSWKPSEEQIYSLGTVVKGVGEASVGSIAYNLKDLYEQLKKL